MTTTHSVPARFISLFRILTALGAIGARAASDAAASTTEPARYVSTQYPPCCALATEIVGCFCIKGYACTVHGEKHYGSHD